jgi:predicted pyridoxine 5'-phosphate oxidase superfamily flavin-nucleotide-binding protein
MSERDPHRITSEAELRALVGAELPGVETKILDRLDEPTRSFLERAPFLVLATSDREGRLDASPKGDGPGFVLIEDERTVVIPDRAGNRLVFGHRNILENPRVGLLLMIPGTSETLRINGHAELTRDPALLERPRGSGSPRAARDPRPDRAVLPPLRQGAAARPPLGPGEVGRSPPRLLWRDLRRANGGRRRRRSPDRRGHRSRLPGQSVRSARARRSSVARLGQGAFAGASCGFAVGTVQTLWLDALDVVALGAPASCSGPPASRRSSSGWPAR